MARILSKLAQILISDTTTTTPTSISPLSSWDLDLSCSEIDVTSITDSNKQYLPGQGDCKGSLTMIADSDSTTLDTITTAKKANTTVVMYVRLEGTGASKKQMKFSAYITGYKISSSTDSRVEISISFVGASDIDYTAQVA